MPIFDVQIVGPLAGDAQRGLARRLADGAGKILAAQPQHVWVTLRWVARDNYAENQSGGSDDQPVLITLTLRDLPATTEMRQQIAALTELFARECARPAENVHIVYAPPARGRIAFGGELVE